MIVFSSFAMLTKHHFHTYLLDKRCLSCLRYNHWWYICHWCDHKVPSSYIDWHSWNPKRSLGSLLINYKIVLRKAAKIENHTFMFSFRNYGYWRHLSLCFHFDRLTHLPDKKSPSSREHSQQCSCQWSDHKMLSSYNGCHNLDPNGCPGSLLGG